MLFIIIQTIILISGVICVYLTQQPNLTLKRYAPIVGIVTTPFWMYSSYSSKQWGVLTLNIFIGIIYIYGFYNSWVKKYN